MKQSFELENVAGIRQAGEELHSCDTDSKKYLEIMEEVAKESGIGSFIRAVDSAIEARQVFGAKCREVGDLLFAVAKDYADLEDELQ